MTMIPTVIDFNSIACGGVRAKVEDHDLLIGDQRVLPNSKLPLLPKLLKGFLDATTAELQNELVRTAEDGAVTSQESFNQGQASLADVRTANVRLQKRRLELLYAENEYHEAFRQMTALIGCLNECLCSAVSKRGQHRSLRPIGKVVMEVGQRSKGVSSHPHGCPAKVSVWLQGERLRLQRQHAWADHKSFPR